MYCHVGIARVFKIHDTGEYESAFDTAGLGHSAVNCSVTRIPLVACTSIIDLHRCYSIYQTLLTIRYTYHKYHRFLFKMNKFMHQFHQDMRIFLLQQEEQYGELKLLSSHDTERTACFDKVIKNIIDFLIKRPGFQMYNIKIFIEDVNLQTRRHMMPLFAEHYNYFLLNTNFSSLHLLRKDLIFGPIVGSWPPLSPYLFIQIIWHTHCEDLLIESLMHIPLDLCVEILDIIVKHIDKLAILRAVRLIFLLIYKIYNKCLWLHFGTVSEQNVMRRINQLIIYFELLLVWLVSSMSVTFSSIESRYSHNGILMKNLLHCINKCMHSKIESYSENHNLAKLFRLTYGNFNECTNTYDHMVPADEVKSIIISFDRKLITLLFNQIRSVDCCECKAWENINDDENPMISLHRAIIMECHYLREFMKQNKYLVTNEQLFLYLERLIGPRKSEKSILTVQEICHEIAKGKLHGIKELSKRYKEWDLSTLDFINQRIKLLSHFDLYAVLEYLHYRFGCLNTKTEKYEVYASILKILNQLNVGTMHTFLLKYVMRHFDDNRLEYLYDEQYFDEFIHNSCISSLRELTPTLSSINDYRILLTFILLNPKEVLSKLVIYEMSTFPNTVLFKNSTHFLRMYYNLHKDCNIQTVLTSILRNIILFQQGVIRENTRFIRFMDNVLHHQMMNANDVINEIYIDYLINCSQGMNLERRNVYTDVILSHIQSILRRQLYTCNIKSALLVTILVKMTSLLRGCNTISKYILYQRVEAINNIISNLQLNVLTEKQNNDLYAVDTCVQPLDIRKLHPGKRTLEIIQEYETRCLSLNERLRTNPRCHPKLRSYMQSFDLNREAFIRHMILHSFAGEYKMYMMDLTFRFWYHLGWTNQRMAYENVMRITAEAMLIVLVYAETFYKDTFILLLYSIVNYCESVTRKMTCDKHKTIRCILLRTLSSMESIVSKTYYARMYNHLLKRIQNLEPRLYQDLNRNTYFKQIREVINEYVDEYDFQTTPLVNTECICDKNFTCTYHDFLIKKKIAEMYNAYKFVCESSYRKLEYATEIQYFERFQRNLCPDE